MEDSERESREKERERRDGERERKEGRSSSSSSSLRIVSVAKLVAVAFLVFVRLSTYGTTY